MVKARLSSKSSLSSSVFKGKNTEEDNDKVEKVLAKLSQINCISNHSITEWACNSIAAKEATVSYEDLSLEFNMILQALQREAAQKWLTVTMYQQKPPTVQVEGEGNEDGTGEEHKQANVKMEGTGEEGFGGDEANNQQDGRNNRNQANQRKRLTLEEYNEQYA